MYVIALQEIQCKKDHAAVISNIVGVMRRRFRFCPHPSFQHANAAGNERRLRLRHQPLLPPPRGSDIAASSSSFSSSSSRSFPCLISLLSPPHRGNGKRREKKCAVKWGKEAEEDLDGCLQRCIREGGTPLLCFPPLPSRSHGT